MIGIHRLADQPAISRHRTIETAWGLAALTANDAGATVMSDLFVAG